MENTLLKSKVNFVSKVMNYMGAGLFITFVTAYFFSTSDAMQNLVFGSGYTVMLIFLAELGLVIYLNKRIASMSFAGARFGFFVYSALNGVLLSSIFLAYTMVSIYSVFLIASLMFVISGLIGISIKKDLSSMSHFLMLSLIGIFVLSIASIFIPGINFMVSLLGVALFSALTAYDMQKIKTIHNNSYSLSTEMVSKYSIIGALTLYLDFINLFLFLLRIFGRRR
jgi:FtsH-binding integral membrane protein